MRKQEGETQINKIRDEKGDITTTTNKIQRIIREYFENLYSRKLIFKEYQLNIRKTYIQGI
jgi:uncharacterized protein YpmS